MTVCWNSLCCNQGARKRKKQKGNKMDMRGTGVGELHKYPLGDHSKSTSGRCKASQMGDSNYHFKEENCKSGARVNNGVSEGAVIETCDRSTSKEKKHPNPCEETSRETQSPPLRITEVQAQKIQKGNKMDKTRRTRPTENCGTCADLNTRDKSATVVSNDSETNSLEKGCINTNLRTCNELQNGEEGMNHPNYSHFEDQKSKTQKITSRKPQSKLLVKLYDRLMSGHFRHLNELLYAQSGEQSRKMMQKDRKLFEQYHKDYQQQMKTWSKQPVDQAIGWLRKCPKHWKVADFGCGDAKLAANVPQVGKIL